MAFFWIEIVLGQGEPKVIIEAIKNNNIQVEMSRIVGTYNKKELQRVFKVNRYLWLDWLDLNESDKNLLGKKLDN